MKSGVALALAIVIAPLIVVLFVLLFVAVQPAITAGSARTMTDVHREISVGTSRDDAYHVLRSHHLTAYNNYYSTYRTTREADGSTFSELITAGEWPEPGQKVQNPDESGPAVNPKHPYVFVEYDAGNLTEDGIIGAIFCSGRFDQDITFDAKDRVDRIVDSPYRETCL
jgi:hypothetical protein